MKGDLGATANRGSILLLLEDSEFLRCIQGEAVKIIKNLLPCFFIIQFVFTTFPDIFWIQYHIVGNLQYGSPSCPLSTLHGERIVGVEQGPHLSSESQSYTSKRMSVIMTSNDVQTFATTYKVWWRNFKSTCTGHLGCLLIGIVYLYYLYFVLIHKFPSEYV